MRYQYSFDSFMMMSAYILGVYSLSVFLNILSRSDILLSHLRTVVMI